MPYLRKINAGLGLVTVLVLFLHISFAYRALSGLENWFTYHLPGITMWFLMLHTVVAVCTVILTRKPKAERQKPTTTILLSRISGVLIWIPLLLTHRQVYATAAMHTLPYAIVEILFCALVTTHIATSAPRAILTLRLVRTEKAAYLMVLSFRVLCALIMVDCVSLILNHIL